MVEAGRLVNVKDITLHIHSNDGVRHQVQEMGLKEQLFLGPLALSVLNAKVFCCRLKFLGSGVHPRFQFVPGLPQAFLGLLQLGDVRKGYLTDSLPRSILPKQDVREQGATRALAVQDDDSLVPFFLVKAVQS